MTAHNAPGFLENWVCDNWKDSYFESKDGRCLGLNGSLCLVNTWNQLVSGAYFQSADLDS